MNVTQRLTLAVAVSWGVLLFAGWCLYMASEPTKYDKACLNKPPREVYHCIYELDHP